MKLYEFTLEIQDGENEYTLSRYVAAETQNGAARYAKKTAQEYQPLAHYDSHSDCWEGRAGYPMWRIGSIRQVNDIIAYAADGTSVVTFGVIQRYRTDGSKPRLEIVRPNHDNKSRSG